MEVLSAKTLASYCKGTPVGNENVLIHQIVRDSRETDMESLFVAIKGERLDGHSFIADVLEKGCGAVLSSEPVEKVCPNGIPETSCVILVEDTIKALGDIGREYKRQFTQRDNPLKTVGITGSVGKTSCKDMIAAALSGGRKTLKTQGNFNNHIGVPLTLLNLDSTTEMAVIEMGMNHFGEIDYAASLAQPDMGVITNVGVAHIEMLGSREGIRKAKLEIVPHLTEGPLLINGDDELLREVKDSLGIAVETFGYKEDNDGKILEAEPTSDGRMHMVFSYEGEIYDLILNTLGRHMAYNVIPAIMTARHFGLTKEEILRGLGGYVATPHRLAPLKVGSMVMIDDTYNASPVSMMAALDATVGIPGEARRVAVLGDMFELGDYSRQGHFEVGEYIAELGREGKKTAPISVLITVGQESEAIAEGLNAHPEGAEVACYHFADKDALLKNALSILKENDIILLKASHGMMFSDIPEKIEALL